MSKARLIVSLKSIQPVRTGSQCAAAFGSNTVTVTLAAIRCGGPCGAERQKREQRLLTAALFALRRLVLIPVVVMLRGLLDQQPADRADAGSYSRTPAAARHRAHHRASSRSAHGGCRSASVMGPAIAIVTITISVTRTVGVRGRGRHIAVPVTAVVIRRGWGWCITSLVGIPRRLIVVAALSCRSRVEEARTDQQG